MPRRRDDHRIERAGPERQRLSSRRHERDSGQVLVEHSSHLGIGLCRHYTGDEPNESAGQRSRAGSEIQDGRACRGSHGCRGVRACRARIAQNPLDSLDRRGGPEPGVVLRYGPERAGPLLEGCRLVHFRPGYRQPSVTRTRQRRPGALVCAYPGHSVDQVTRSTIRPPRFRFGPVPGAVAAAVIMSAGLAACGSGSLSLGRTRSSSTTSSPSGSSHAGSGSSTTSSGSGTTRPPPSTIPLKAPSSLPKPAPIGWTKCSSLAADAVTSVGSFQCGSLKVPISYSDPGAGSLSLALVRLPASGPAPARGDIVTNPGGPGGSGVDFLEQNANGFPSSLRSEFNLVSFDPRGVARSDPVSCVTAAGIRQLLSLNPAPVGSTQIDQVVAATKAFDEGCAEHTSRLLLENMSTVDVAIDMDELRAALGQPKLTYLGFSYGTYLGAIYAQLFPTHVRAMVLDGALNPDLSNNELSLEQAESFEVDLHDFFYVVQHRTPPASRSSPAARRRTTSIDVGSRERHDASRRARRLIRREPDRRLRRRGDRRARVPLLDKATGRNSAQALQQAIGGDGSDLDAIALSYAGFQPNGSLENIEESNLAVNCLDHPVPTTIVRLRLARSAVRGQSPGLRPARGLGIALLRLLAGPTDRRPRTHPRPRSSAHRGGRDDPRPGHPLRMGAGARISARQRVCC